MSRSVTPSAHSRRHSPLDRRRALRASASVDLSTCFAAAAATPTGFEELSRLVAAQQQQMDQLVDNVAALMSNMRTGVLGDVRRSRRPQSATLGALQCASRDRGAEGGGLRLRKQDQLKGACENLDGKLHASPNDPCNELWGRFMADVNSLRTRISHLEDLIDRDEVAQLRRSMEAQLQAIRKSQPDGSFCREQVAEEVMACVEARLQLQMEDEGSALGLFREQLRKEAESRVEAKMTQGFGLTQRLMVELRNELLVHVHEGTKRLAVEFNRSLEEQELQMAHAVQYTLSKGRAKGDGDASTAEDLSSTRLDSMEDRFAELSQQLKEEVHRELDAQQVAISKTLQLIVRDGVQHKAAAVQPVSSMTKVKCGDQAVRASGVVAEHSQAKGSQDAKLDEHESRDFSCGAAGINKEPGAGGC